MNSSEIPIDEIGQWSEIKLEIITRYAVEYSKILEKQPLLKHVYIDAFAGAGIHLSKTSKTFIHGSPINALQVEPPFTEYYFIDINSEKVKLLRKFVEDAKGKRKVHILEGDSNVVLLKDVFPKINYDDYKRGLCFLDPYGMHLDWNVVHTAGRMKSIELIINFAIHDINRNALLRNPEKASIKAIDRMNRFWGDDSWRKFAYKMIPTLFGEEEQKLPSSKIVNEYRNRLKKISGFNFVPKPLPMKNTKGAIVFYIFFASQNKTGNKIISHIFDKYR